MIRHTFRLIISLKKQRYAVGHLRHAAEEQAALGQQQNALQVAAAKAVHSVAQEGHRRGDVALGGRKTGHAVRGDEIRHLRRGDFLAHGREAGDNPVVEERHVATARRLRDFWVVQLGSVLVDIAEAQSKALQGLADKLLENGLLGRSGRHGVAAQGIQPQPGRNTVIGAHQDCHGRQHILQDGLVVLHVAAVLHPQLGKRTTADDEDVRKHAGR